jgi:hypothetical protein
MAAERKRTDDSAALNELIEALGEASIVCLSSAARYWMRVAEVCAKHYPSFADLFGDGDTTGAPGPDRVRVATERLQACLRELADLPVEEAQRVRVELERLASTSGPAADDHGPYWRRWTVKP